jgi:hypothetical protein
MPLRPPSGMLSCSIDKVSISIGNISVRLAIYTGALQGGMGYQFRVDSDSDKGFPYDPQVIARLSPHHGMPLNDGKGVSMRPPF